MKKKTNRIAGNMYHCMNACPKRRKYMVDGRCRQLGVEHSVEYFIFGV